MEEINIILHKNVNEFLDELIFILFENDYFGFEESAQEYVQKIYDFIEFNLSTFPYKNTPAELHSLGSKYASYKANQNTTWYIFFENFENKFIVTYIANNHLEIAKFL